MHPSSQQRLSLHSQIACEVLSLSKLLIVSDPGSVKVSLEKALALSIHFVGYFQGSLQSF